MTGMVIMAVRLVKEAMSCRGQGRGQVFWHRGRGLFEDLTSLMDVPFFNELDMRRAVSVFSSQENFGSIMPGNGAFWCIFLINLGFYVKGRNTNVVGLKPCNGVQLKLPQI